MADGKQRAQRGEDDNSCRQAGSRPSDNADHAEPRAAKLRVKADIASELKCSPSLRQQRIQQENPADDKRLREILSMM